MPTLGIWEFDILEDDPLRLAGTLTVTVRNVVVVSPASKSSWSG